MKGSYNMRILSTEDLLNFVKGGSLEVLPRYDLQQRYIDETNAIQDLRQRGLDFPLPPEIIFG